jgi:OFA family oxalate/formate antiporter-like MFS transporter
LTVAVGSTVISFARDLALSVGAEAALATMLVGVLSVSNGLGRIVCGLIFDVLGRRRTMLIANLLAILAPATVLLSIIKGSLALCIVGLCVTGISYGCCPTITAAFIGAFYGTKYFPTNYSTTNLMLIPASFVATISGAMQESTGSFIAPFVMLLIFAACALIINLNIRKP